MKDLAQEYESNQRQVRESLGAALGAVSNMTIPSAAPVATPVRNTQTKSTTRKPRQASTSDRGSKKQFVENMFRTTPTISPKDIQQAWVDEGNTDTISASLIYKIKGDLREELGQPSSGRGRKRAAASRKETTTPRKNVKSDDVSEDVPNLKPFIMKVLHRGPYNIAEITEVIETENLIEEVPDNLADIVMRQVGELKEEGKVERTEGRKYTAKVAAGV
jgi:hypothetical protein